MDPENGSAGGDGTSMGAPSLDRDRIPRPQGMAIDVGAYEWHEGDVMPVDAGGRSEDTGPSTDSAEIAEPIPNREDVSVGRESPLDSGGSSSGRPDSGASAGGDSDSSGCSCSSSPSRPSLALLFFLAPSPHSDAELAPGATETKWIDRARACKVGSNGRTTDLRANRASMQAPHFDVLVIGAGLSGICAGYYLKEETPGKSFAILEGRDSLGGTWDLFQYPGIRSDSDMHTLGFSFRPWPNPQAIADGPSILEYLHDTVEETGLDRKIRYNHRVDEVSWSSDEERWTVRSRHPETGEERVFTCNFLWCCTGYYRYDHGHMPDFPGTEAYDGELVHPQSWTDDIEYEDQEVVVIGSGATAVTLVPAMAELASHVTMLQRSPTYVISLPEEDVISEWMKRLLGDRIGSALTRWKNVLIMMLFYQFSRRMPETARAFIMDGVREAVGDAVDVDTHFNPRYDPWDQRLCFVPDGDLFEVLRDGSASVVTDHIETFTESGIELRSGNHLDADLVVSATGLELVVAGGATIEVDGEVIDPGEETMYKGTMLTNVPNAVISVGYTNASWTLKCELISRWACRLLHYMDDHGHTVCVPTLPDGADPDRPLIDLDAGYVRRALDDIPNQGDRLPWRLYQNYFLDSILFRFLPVADDALHMR